MKTTVYISGNDWHFGLARTQVLGMMSLNINPNPTAWPVDDIPVVEISTTLELPAGDHLSSRPRHRPEL